MKKFFKWLIFIFCGGLALSILASIIERTYFEDTTVPSLLKGIASIITIIWSFLSVEFPAWYCLLIIGLVVFAWVLDRRGFFKPKPKAIQKPDFHKYTEDVFGVDEDSWVWYWVDDEVEGLSPACPTCGRPGMINHLHPAQMLQSINTGTYFDCSKCRLEGKKSDFYVSQNSMDVRLEIYRRVDSGEYKKAIKNFK